jgi:hypothetical protein
MITATNKFSKAWKNKDPKSEIVEFLFYRGNPYENRIEMARERLSKIR